MKDEYIDIIVGCLLLALILASVGFYKLGRANAETEVVPSRNLPKRLLCDICVSDDTGNAWVFCRYDTSSWRPIDTPEWCSVIDSLQLDLDEDEENLLYGTLDWKYNTTVVSK